MSGDNVENNTYHTLRQHAGAAAGHEATELAYAEPGSQQGSEGQELEAIGLRVASTVTITVARHGEVLRQGYRELRADNRQPGCALA